MSKHASLRCINCSHEFGSTDEYGKCRATVLMDGLHTPCFCMCEYVQDPHPGAGGLHEERVGNLGEVIDRRVQVYGDPVEAFTRVAQVWSGILGHEVQPWEVPLCMMGLKMVRADYMPDYGDNSDDVDGYLDIFRKIIGDDMIHARSVTEFIAQKWPNG